MVIRAIAKIKKESVKNNVSKAKHLPLLPVMFMMRNQALRKLDKPGFGTSAWAVSFEYENKLRVLVLV